MDHHLLKGHEGAADGDGGNERLVGDVVVVGEVKPMVVGQVLVGEQLHDLRGERVAGAWRCAELED